MPATFSTPTYFQEEPVPKDTKLAGMAALVQALKIMGPVRHLSCISLRHVKGNQRQEGRWLLFDKRYQPENSIAGHLEFALQHEPIDLLLLKRIFAQKGMADAITEIAKSTPNGATARRLWFLYEKLLGRKLKLPSAPVVTAVGALDPKKYVTTKGELSVRHRVHDNLLGTGDFCPVIRRTEALEEFIRLDLGAKAQETIGRTGAHLIARAASFLLLADSRASFAIEGEKPPQSRLERWGKAVLEAGKRPLNQTEIYRLHRILLGDDDRFTEIGYRKEGVFLGERDHLNNPLPEFIGAKHDDLEKLMGGLSACNERLRASAVDPVLQAAAIAFGFVYIHPLADGNGRLHRCLIHHVLAERRFPPPGMVFPVSSVMLDRIDDYRTTLQGHSGPLMGAIEWKSTKDHNVEVLNETADLYRYYDCTAEAEFLYRCVRRTVEEDLPREIDYLKRHDRAKKEITNLVEMPDRLVQNLILFIRDNGGTLSKKRRKKDFDRLADEELRAIEAAVQEAFSGFDPANSGE